MAMMARSPRIPDDGASAGAGTASACLGRDALALSAGIRLDFDAIVAAGNARDRDACTAADFSPGLDGEVTASGVGLDGLTAGADTDATSGWRGGVPGMKGLRAHWPLGLLCTLLAGCGWLGGVAQDQTSASSPTPGARGVSAAPVADVASAANPADAASAARGARAGSAANGEPAFDIRVDCPDEALQDLVTRFNDLQRYRAVRDLDSAELARLMALAQRNVRELLATQGYFSPDVSVRLEGAVVDDGNDEERAALSPVPARADANGGPGTEGRQPAASASSAAAASSPASSGSAARPVVVVAIVPGPAAAIGQSGVDFSGDIARTSDADAVAQRDRITQHWNLMPGDRFTQEGWGDAKTAALRALVERRYPRGRISFSQADVDAPGARANLAVTLDSGPPFYLGAATVTGAARYPATLPERQSWLKPGDVYDQQKLVDAQQRLAASGYYDSAYVSIDPDTDTPDAAPVHYSVTEAKRYKLQLGVGYSTDSGPRESVNWRDNTFLGTSWRNDTTLNINPKEPLMQTGLTSLPDASGWQWNGLARMMQQDDGQLSTHSQTLRAGRMQSTPQFDRSVYWQYDNAVVTGSGAASNVMVGDGAAASINMGWTGRYFDSMTLPRRGFGLSGEVGAGVTTKGPMDPFVRLSGRWLGLLPVGGDGSSGSRVAMRTELGALLSTAAARVPATYLWRTGGDTTVRGYAYRSIGVPLTDGVIAPGRYLAVGSIEYQRPILQRRFPGLLEHVLFVDAGDVANHAGQLRPRVGVGTGLRLITPAGPMELDMAYGVKSRQFRLHMNVGFTF